MCVYIYVCVYVCVYVCMYVYVCIYIYIYIVTILLRGVCRPNMEEMIGDWQKIHIEELFNLFLAPYVIRE